MMTSFTHWQKPRVTKTFRVGSVPVTLVSEEPRKLERTYDLLAQLFVLGPASNQTGVQLHFSASPLPERAGQTVYSAKALVVTANSGLFFLCCGRSQLYVNPERATASCFLASDFLSYSPFEKREFFLLGLLMLLRPYGCYGLHACGLERSGVGVLLVGASGSGKTTTSLSLVQSGWQYLSDDAVLLTSLADDIVKATAFRRGFSCTPETLVRFPDLTGDSDFGDPDGKRVVHPGDTFGSFTTTCVPSLIVFPKVTAASQTTLRPLTAADSLIRLSQQSAGIMTDAAVSQRQLELLKNLTEQTQSFELLLGPDALNDPSRIDTLVRSVVLGPDKETSPCASLSN